MFLVVRARLNRNRNALYSLQNPFGGGQIPLDDRELLICAFDHEPMDGILTDRTANLAPGIPSS
jgi:hypothetical protein